jgi:glycosyltransferase involved in cell wall biosynthesis
LIVAAYNEEDIIAEKVQNSLALEYPGELEIVVFSDASSDSTDIIVQEYEPAVKLIRIEGRVGKTACQNQVTERVDTDVVVFSDANSMYKSDAITKLVNRLSTGVDCVVGELRYSGGEVDEESMYWRLERAVKRGEAATGNVVAGNGAIYAIRQSSYVPLAHDEISDFAEPLAILAQGGTVKYAPEAIATERTAGSITSELGRRVRITTRSWHTLARYRGLLNPLSRPGVALKLTSHKLLRWLSPVQLIIVTITTIFAAVLTRSPVVIAFFGIQVLCYALGIGGVIAERRGQDLSTPLLSVPAYFLLENYGLGIGLWNFLRGRNIVVWETESRGSAADLDSE